MMFAFYLLIYLQTYIFRMCFVNLPRYSLTQQTDLSGRVATSADERNSDNDMVEFLGRLIATVVLWSLVVDSHWQILRG